VLDFGSFVSPKAIPQMQDTPQVLDQLELNPKTKMLAIIANERGANDAVKYQGVDILGFPFSVSETFQQRNTNASIEQSLENIQRIQDLCAQHDKTLLVYLSMAYGNPYGDEWSENIVSDWLNTLAKIGIKDFALADTIGVSTPDNIKSLYTKCKSSHPNLNIGLHLHSSPMQLTQKIEAALSVRPDFMDAAIKGFGGCPMAKDDLTGNIATERLIELCHTHHIPLSINENYFKEAMLEANQVFATA
jgi:hydroxymethylglutaryl-CoA lyase